mgnify:CR=1 FL=1
MRKLTEFFIKRPVIFWSMVVAILLAGVLSFLSMPKLEDPAISGKQAMVVILYPGASAHDVELNVALKVEDALRALPDVSKVKTECQNGSAMITVEFKMTVLNDKLQEHFDLLRRKVNDVAVYLPQDCRAPIVIDDMTDTYGIFYALYGDGYEYSDLDKYAKYVSRAIMDVKGVKRVNVIGVRDEVISVTLSKEMIARNGLIPTQVMMALQGACKSVDAGSVASGEERVAVRIDGKVKDENDVRDLIVSTVDGKIVRLGDVATVTREYSEPQRNGFFVDGHPAVAICAAMEADAIVPDVGNAVETSLSEIEGDLPAGMTLEKIFFQPDKVRSAISSFMLNLLESVLIVILVLVFAMGFRSGVIIGFGLVLTVAVSFPVLLMMGTTLQRISLGAFIIAMGMLVDNAVVIIDGILVDKKRGFGPKTYLYRIGQNTALPLLGATVIAAVTFISVYLSPDTAGEYASDLFLVLCVSLLASWILALVQVPYCAKVWLPRHYKDNGGKDTGVMNSPVHRAIRKVLTTLVAHKAVTVGAAVVLLVVSILGIFKVKNLFFPDFDYNEFVVECYFPAQTSSDEVRDHLEEMREMLKDTPEITRVSASQGSAPAHYCLVRPMTSGGDCYGELMLDCENYKDVQKVIPVVRRQLRDAFPEAYIRIRKYNFSISTSHTVEAEFTGPDPAVLRDLSAQAEDIMRSCPYVDKYSVQNNWKPMGKSYLLSFNQLNALRGGISRGDVGNALQASGDGLPVGVVNDQDRMVLVDLKVRNADGSAIGSMKDVPVWSMLNVHIPDDQLKSALISGKLGEDIQERIFRSVPLAAVTDSISVRPEESVVLRVNGRRSIEAECDPDPENPDATPAKVMSFIRSQVEAISLPEGYSLRWNGDSGVQSEAMGNVFKYLPLTLMLMLGILLLLFGTWKKVALIIICFPFVFCGITPALLLSGQPFTFMAMIGMIGLIGMMVKNAIVLVDEIARLQTEEGFTPYNAVIEATVSRVRPVLMASLTTIVGMVPLLGDPMYGAMAVSIMAGLAVGTLITLILLPVLYSTFYHISK